MKKDMFLHLLEVLMVKLLMTDIIDSDSLGKKEY